MTFVMPTAPMAHVLRKESSKTRHVERRWSRGPASRMGRRVVVSSSRIVSVRGRAIEAGGGFEGMASRSGATRARVPESEARAGCRALLHDAERAEADEPRVVVEG